MSQELPDDIFPEPDDAENRRIKALLVGSDRTRVKLDLRVQGRDLVLLVTGGKAHVGAVGVWDSRNEGPGAVVTQMIGHREGPLAGECAEVIGSASGRNVAALVGIHQDHATREEIAAIVEGVREGLIELAAFLASGKDVSA